MPILRHPNSVAEDGANVDQESNLETHTKQMLCLQVGTQMSRESDSVPHLHHAC